VCRAPDEVLTTGEQWKTAVQEKAGGELPGSSLFAIVHSSAIVLPFSPICERPAFEDITVPARRAGNEGPLPMIRGLSSGGTP
jgi:hypothetical protein